VKKIIVLGPGCPRCESLAKLTCEAADQLGLEYQLEKLTDIKRFADFGLMLTPGLVVDGQLKVQGKIPSREEIMAFLA
jgi:small redox-active disulfide protein 2